jgi:mitochondrial import receptor subunit TOM70
MSQPGLTPVPPQPIHISTPAFSNSTTSDSLWDRISNWASENKAVVYTIAGVTLVVTGAGVYYYLVSEKGTQPTAAPSGKKKSKKNKKAKKDDDSASKSDVAARQEPAAASVASGDLPSDLEEITEEFIASLSEQVRFSQSHRFCSNILISSVGTKRHGFQA